MLNENISLKNFAENFPREDFFIEQARFAGVETGIPNPTPASGSFISQIASLIHAKSVVEIGSGSGVGALWLYSGMENNGVVTTIDQDREAGSITRKTLEEAGIASQRYRIITGSPLEVVNKLADTNYDLIVIRLTEDLLDVIQETYRLLKDKGVLILDNAFGGGKVADPTARDFATIARRDGIKALKDQDRWRSTMVEVGDGIVFAIKQ